ncbi:hypothetical protein CATYP_05965 [Corynebacterium atypicum]|uniref:Uncharacterized protein n=1 Tax=Corynebacterium atypicum TaxID=191610 RepID=A0ABN4DCX4_9CORY|nr:hypothetical protein [Corynebacterium atypicum]AIG64238.1 hypothetical protein CATYP_05965 [Corynebacterium atypicum]
MSTTATDVRKSKLAEDLRLSAELNPIGRRAAARDRIMAAMAVTSLAVAAWMLSTAAAGLLMFYRRAHAAPGTLDPRVDGNEFLQPYLDSYVFLGIVACVLVVPSVIALAANAAVLGATGREKKMAMLRLLGGQPRESHPDKPYHHGRPSTGRLDRRHRGADRDRAGVDCGGIPVHPDRRL